MQSSLITLCSECGTAKLAWCLDPAQTMGRQWISQKIYEHHLVWYKCTHIYTVCIKMFRFYTQLNRNSDEEKKALLSTWIKTTKDVLPLFLKPNSKCSPGHA